MNSIKFAWLYLIEHGAAGMEPSYYGGYDCVDQRMKGVKLTWDETYLGHKKHYLDEIKTIGINWDATPAPESDILNMFQGTFCDSERKEFLKGKLVLNNGLIQTWCSEAIEVSNAFEMMADVAGAVDRAKELFGECNADNN